MKALKIILYVIVSLVIITAMIYANYKGFSNVSVQIKEEGGEHLVYREVKGPYSETRVVLSKIMYDLKSQFKIEPNKSFGIYFDDPQKVDKNKLRSEVGCILENVDTLHVFWLKSNFKTKVLPKKNYITAEFPFKGKMSIMIGIMKVYPALKEYVKANGYSEEGPIMEIYDMPNNKILYLKEAIKNGK
jgi:effector-binding domain-containing protein